MKVLIINSVCGIRSTGRICTDIATRLEAEGHECVIAYGRENVPERYKKYSKRIGTEGDVKAHALKSRIFDNSGFLSTKYTKKFISWVKEYDPDVIHLHNLHGYYVNVKILFDYFKKSGKKVIWTMHDCWAFTGHCAHFDSIGCNKWLSGCYKCPKKKSYPASLFFDRSKKNYEEKKASFGSVPMQIVCPSKWLADFVRLSFLGHNEICVIPNGIDTGVFKKTESDFRSRYGLEEKKIVLGVASAWGRSKGLYDFYKLAEILPEDYKIVLVGLKNEQLESVPDGIIGISRTNSTEELAAIYTAADVFVNPTYNDTYPTVNLEAQACGTPVITYRTGGSVESVADDCIVDKGDVKALADKIMRCDAGFKDGLLLDKNDMAQMYIELYLK